MHYIILWNLSILLFYPSIIDYLHINLNFFPLFSPRTRHNTSNENGWQSVSGKRCTFHLISQRLPFLLFFRSLRLSLFYPTFTILMPPAFSLFMSTLLPSYEKEVLSKYGHINGTKSQTDWGLYAPFSSTYTFVIMCTVCVWIRTCMGVCMWRLRVWGLGLDVCVNSERRWDSPLSPLALIQVSLKRETSHSIDDEAIPSGIRRWSPISTKIR